MYSSITFSDRAPAGRHRNQLRIILTIVLLLLPVFAQDPVAVDPQHDKIEYEDAKVRVIRFTLAPGEKSAMHDHPEMIIVNLTNARARMISPDGEVQELDLHAGDTLHREP